MDGRPAYVQLIRDRREELELSIREAARRAASSGRKFSEGGWRRIEKPGTQTRPPETIARMAQVVGVTPAELEARGCPAAARLLPGLPPLREQEVDLQAVIEDMKVRMARLEKRAARWPGQPDDDDDDEGTLGDDIRRASG
jgi:hypothetical protein